ncbi:glycoside hydrolase family 16 protein [Actinomadura sp. HBU206391]|uniref:glycoside hydrolase family 16 protein n=1 Tax=Actinomadura sp. HBU206391 TaxID=2731692 RepID=UPI001650927D|nr:glycoside hydrolase family 16 protein [Actinomadura sp. HBU206391]MBC6460847.1 glycoside hydrolase family 16 protein [Actinomadura sp. HBU206391]
MSSSPVSRAAVAAGAFLIGGMAIGAALPVERGDPRLGSTSAGHVDTDRGRHDECSHPGGSPSTSPNRMDVPPPARTPAAPSTPSDDPQTAAERHGWTDLVARDDFQGDGVDRAAWEIYDGAGHAGNGRRSPEAVSVREGVLTITGRPDGTTGAMAWKRGAQKTGRWEARVRMSRGCACYHPVLLLWPVHGGGGVAPAGGEGEVDYMEVIDSGRRDTASFFLHFGPPDRDHQKHARVMADLTEWHHFAVEWTSGDLTGFIDGRRWFHTDDRAALPLAEMGQTIQLDWFPEDRAKTADGIARDVPATMEVDWIKMYRL